MRTVPWWKPALVLVLTLAAVYYLYPSAVWYGSLVQVQDPDHPDIPHSPQLDQLNRDLADLTAKNATDEATLARIEDLHVQIREEERAFYSFKDRRVPLGLDLNGGIQLRLRVLVDREASAEQQRETVDQVLLVYKERIDKLGLTEPLVEKQPDNTILIQIPGVTNAEQVISIIKTTAELKFQLSPNLDEGAAVLAHIDEALKKDVSSRLQAQGGDQLCQWRVASDDIRYVSDTVFGQEARSKCWNPEYGFYWGEEEKDKDGKKFRNLYMLENKVDVSGRYIDQAKVAFEQSMITQPHVQLRFKDEGKRKFSVLTRNSVNRHLAVVLDGVVYSAPVIREPITQGVASIEGRFSTDEARHLALVLEAGALSRPVEIIQNITVGAQMGAESIHKGANAALIGTVAVVLFMVVYYSFGGAVADFALLFNALFMAAGLAMFKATLTMPGIAGLVLTLGMAVDANVLIFERMREERSEDRLISSVIDRGYTRAFSAILDGNLTTLLTALVLFQFGTGPVKGYAVTLSIGLIVSLFTALFITRMVFDYLYGRSKLGAQISLGKIQIFQNAKFDFMSYGLKFSSVSCIFIVLSMTYTVVCWNKHLGIEFAGGNLVQVSFEKPRTAENVRQLVEEMKVENPIIQTIGRNSTDFIIRVHKDAKVPAEVLEKQKDLELTTYIKQELVARCADNPIVPGKFSVEKVSSVVGQELRSQALLAIFFAIIGMVIYITIRFELIYAIGAVVALFHDVFFALGALYVWNIFFPGHPRELTLQGVAALLTIFGYSVNDTIVVFDRIRENRRKAKGLLRDIINESINQTLSRTLITFGVTLLSVLAVLFFGGPTLNDFAFLLTIGFSVGVYSSIFIASWAVFLLGQRAITRAR